MAFAELTDLDKELLTLHVGAMQPPHCYMEIGVKYGGSAEVARRANRDIDVYGVDPEPKLQFSDFHFIEGYSVYVAQEWDKPIGVLFIDGDHDQALDDFEAWIPHVVPDGIIIFHDYAHHSPKVVADCNLIAERYEVIRKPGTLMHDDSSFFIVRNNATSNEAR